MTSDIDTIKTVGDLLEYAKDHPEVLWRAHRAAWQAISSTDEKPALLSETDDVKLHNLYHDQPSRRMRFPAFKELFGIDPILAEVGEYFRAGASGRSKKRRILAISGPHGCGKTTGAQLIAQAMEEYAHFAIECCDYHENILHAIPRKLRDKYHSDFFYFEGQLCAQCEERLQNREFNGSWEKLPVIRRKYRMGAGIGMLRVEDSLPEATNAGEIPESWLWVFRRSNGGILFVDLSEGMQPKGFRRMIGNLVTDGSIRTRDQTEVYLDIAIVSISNKNPAEESAMEALGDRIQSVKFHLPLDPNSELKIHTSEQKNSADDVHFMPGILPAFSHLVSASRIEPTDQAELKLTVEDTLLFYAGETKLSDNVKGLVTHTYKAMHKKRPLDGIKGLTERDVGDLLDEVSQYHSCIGIQHMLSALRSAELNKGKFFDIRDRIMPWIGTIEPDANGKFEKGKMEKLYETFALLDLTRGWVGIARFEKAVQTTFKNYLENVIAYTETKKIKDPTTNEYLPPNESLMRSVENWLKVTQTTEKDFRIGLVAFFYQQRPREVLSDHLPLQHAIEKMLVAQHKEEIKEAIVITNKTKDPERARLKLESAKKELITHCEYQECCWVTLESYARRTLFA